MNLTQTPVQIDLLIEDMQEAPALVEDTLVIEELAVREEYSACICGNR